MEIMSISLSFELFAAVKVSDSIILQPIDGYHSRASSTGILRSLATAIGQVPD